MSTESTSSNASRAEITTSTSRPTKSKAKWTWLIGILVTILPFFSFLVDCTGLTLDGWNTYQDLPNFGENTLPTKEENFDHSKPQSKPTLTPTIPSDTYQAPSCSGVHVLMVPNCGSLVYRETGGSCQIDPRWFSGMTEPEKEWKTYCAYLALKDQS